MAPSCVHGAKLSLMTSLLKVKEDETMDENAIEVNCEDPPEYRCTRGPKSTPPSATENDTQDVDVPLIRRVLTKALEAQRVKNYKNASIIFQEVLHLLPKQRICLRGLGSMALTIRKYPEAIRWLEEGVKSYPSDVLFHARLGDAYFGQGKNEEALSQYDLALGLVMKQSTSQIPSSSYLFEYNKNLRTTLQLSMLSEEGSGELRTVDDQFAGDIGGSLTLNDLKIASARVLHKMGAEALGYSIVMAILKEDPEQLDALYEYGVLLFGHGLVKEALQIFLKLLILKPGNKAIRSMVSNTLKLPRGIEILKKVLVNEEGCAGALAFIASCIKDYGAINEAVELYNTAIILSPSTVGYVLSLIHLYEISNEHMRALDTAVSWCEKLPTFTFQRFQLSNVEPYLHGLTWKEISNEVNEKCQGVRYQTFTETLRRLDHELLVSKSNLAIVGDSEGERLWSYEVQHGKLGEKQDSKYDYDDDHLDGLAILFTVVKILYVGGALKRAKSLARIVEPARVRSSMALHQTLVRNEAAYFSLVHQILEQHPLPVPISRIAEQYPLYLAGDSHCLSAAWRTVALRSQNRLLVPLLVTGLKVWHLRKESQFYPKVAFHKAMQSVADGAQLIMVCGEIDCREGIVVAVDKCLYKDVEEGAKISVELYLETLEQLIEDRGFEIFVHPIPPVLDETRSIVHVFNSILKKRVQEVQGKSKFSKRLHYLNFYSDLTTSEGTLKDEFKLDGTHVSPRYHLLLNRELNRLA